MPTNMTQAIPPTCKKEQGCNIEKVSLKKQNEPRLVGAILHELINTSDEPLYKGYRAHLATKETDAEKGGKENG